MPSSFQTPTGNLTRELAAIMFSDVVGYTAIMGRDEQQALRTLEDHRELLRLLLPKFNGRMVGEVGDGTLTSFHGASLQPEAFSVLVSRDGQRGSIL